MFLEYRFIYERLFLCGCCADLNGVENGFFGILDGGFFVGEKGCENISALYCNSGLCIKEYSPKAVNDRLLALLFDTDEAKEIDSIAIGAEKDS